MTVNEKKMHKTSFGNLGSLAADVIIYFIVGIACLSCVWPFIYVLSMSLSDPNHILDQSVWLFPRGFNTEMYGFVFSDAGFWNSYKNTLIYVISGTILSIILSLLSAYPLTKRNLFGRKALVAYYIITMYFSGGLIPSFIINTKIGLYNNPLIMVLPVIISVWNIIIIRTFIMTLPGELIDAALIDGAGEYRLLFQIIAPLSKPIIAVVALYTAVGIWNSWFSALIYLPDEKWHPLQLYLARMLVFQKPEVHNQDILNQEIDKVRELTNVLRFRYTVIVLSILPIACTYPFMQKYFIKGIMLGSLKA